LNVTFTDKSKNASTALWYFGLTNTSKEKNPTYTFNNPGTYRVVLEVSNGRGWDATAQEITVLGQQKVIPEAGFDADTSNDLDVQFADTSQNANGWNWNFGDGTNSTDQNPEHTYSSAGNYTVNLTASNENGTVSVNKTIDVEEVSSSSDDSSSSDSSSSDDSSSSSGSSVGTASIVGSSGSSSSSSSQASVITVANESNDSTVNASTNSTNVSASPENQSNLTVNETQANTTQDIEQNNSSTAATEQTSEQTPNTTSSENGDKKSPGFESAFGIVGLLAAVFLYKRK
jgi:PKD repeat protein